MPDWVKILGAIGTLAAVGTAWLNYQSKRRADRDRLAAYLDRIAVMLEEMADELALEGKSPARCVELIEAIGNLEPLILKIGSASGNSHGLLDVLHEVDNVPGFVVDKLSAERELVFEVERLLKSGRSLTFESDKIRKASGMFKGAAEAIKAN